MHFLFVLLRLVLDRLIPTWRDGLSMAARADGRIEHLPKRSALWDCWLQFTGQLAPRRGHEREKVRAGRGASRLRHSHLRQSHLRQSRSPERNTE